MKTKKMIPVVGETKVYAQLYNKDRGCYDPIKPMIFCGFGTFNHGLNGQSLGVIVGEEKKGRYVLEVAMMKHCEFEFKGE
jgi:hypothetical protein